MSAEKEEAGEEAAPKASLASKLPLILLGVNLLVILAALGTLVYTKLIFKRPPITEETERKRLAVMKEKTESAGGEAAIISFDTVTANIARTGGAGPNHYATVGLAVEIRDRTRSGDIDSCRALLMDKFLSLLGHKQISELDNVQGRYVLRTELIDAFNQVIFNNAGHIKGAPDAAPPPAAEAHGEGGGEGGGEHGGGEHAAPKAVVNASPRPPVRDLVSNIFFSQFTVQ